MLCVSWTETTHAGEKHYPPPHVPLRCERFVYNMRYMNINVGITILCLVNIQLILLIYNTKSIRVITYLRFKCIIIM